MSNEFIICFGQQPCGFFPKRFLVAKINTARRLQKEIGGRIVFFYHDSDHDYRETITLMRDVHSGEDVRHNFKVLNKIQKKYSPMYLKKIEPGWHDYMSRQLPRFVGSQLMDIFASVSEHKSVADFCLEMYTRMRLLEGIEIVRSSDTDFRERASDLVDDYFAEVPYEGEIVRARKQGKRLFLHRGGGMDIELPPTVIEKRQKTPPAGERFGWMQSVLGCTHYVIGEGEREYLDTRQFPDVVFVQRDIMAQAEYSFIDLKITDFKNV